MRKQLILCLKVAWIVAALMALLMDSSVCGYSDQACPAAGDTMLLFMVLLTFPTGLVCILVSILVCELIGGQHPSGYLLAWFVMACGGCLQWFIIVPLLLEEPAFTVLDLNSTPASTALRPSAAGPSSITEKPQVISPIIQAPLRIRARKLRQRITAFDKFGRSPVERVINR